MKTPQVHPPAPRQGLLDLNPSLGRTQACESNTSSLIKNASFPPASEECVLATFLSIDVL